jgi:hypothetical protein
LIAQVLPAALDPLIHVPTRLKIVATPAALPDGDTLSFARLQEMLELTPGSLEPSQAARDLPDLGSAHFGSAARRRL